MESQFFEELIEYLREKEWVYTAIICSREDYLEIGNRLESRLWKEKISYQTIIPEFFSSDEKTLQKEIEAELEDVEVLLCAGEEQCENESRKKIKQVCEKIAKQRGVGIAFFEQIKEGVS